MAEKILVGLDGSRPSWSALDEAIKQASFKNSTVLIVTTAEDKGKVANGDKTPLTETPEQLRLLHRRALDRARECGVEAEAVVLRGGPVKEIIEYIREQQIGLLIIGHKGRSSFWNVLAGSNMQKFVREAPCSVLVVR